MKHPECRGTAGAKSADTVETTIPLAKAVIATNSKRNGGEGKANAGAGGNSFGKVKGGGGVVGMGARANDAETLQNKSQRIGTRFHRLSRFASC